MFAPSPSDMFSIEEYLISEQIMAVPRRDTQFQQCVGANGALEICWTRLVNVTCNDGRKHTKDAPDEWYLK